MTVPEVDEVDPVLADYTQAREQGEHGPAFNQLYDHAQEMHEQMLELRAGYDRCRKNKGVLILLRKKAIQERDEALNQLEQLKGDEKETGRA